MTFTQTSACVAVSHAIPVNRPSHMIVSCTTGNDAVKTLRGHLASYRCPERKFTRLSRCLEHGNVALSNLDAGLMDVNDVKTMRRTVLGII